MTKKMQRKQIFATPILHLSNSWVDRAGEKSISSKAYLLPSIVTTRWSRGVTLAHGARGPDSNPGRASS